MTPPRTTDLSLAENSIRQNPAEERREGRERRVETVNLVGDLDVVLGSEDALDGGSKYRETRNVGSDVRQRNPMRDIERKERPHAVLAKALPHLREEEDEEACRVAQDVASAGRRGSGEGHAPPSITAW